MSRACHSMWRLNVTLAMHHTVSVQQDKQDALFTFSLLRFMASTCFEHLLAHHEDTLYIQQLVYFVCIITIVYTVLPDDEQISAQTM
jgi:hypothetical protein